MLEVIDRLRAALAQAGLERAVLSHPETLAHLCLFDPAVEEWPVANPFVASPALLSLTLDEATLLVASFHAARDAGLIEPGAITAFAGLSLGEYTALHLAALKGNDKVVQYLISRGARVDIKNKLDKTAGEVGPKRPPTY